MKVRQVAYTNMNCPYPAPLPVFENTESILAVGKLFVYGDFVTRYLVKTGSGIYFVNVSQQEKSVAAWLRKLGKRFNPSTYPTRELPFILVWHEITQES